MGRTGGLAFVVLFVAAFALGIEVGATDQEILDYYADSGHRAKEVAAFFLIAGAALAFLVFVGFLVLALWVLAVSAALAFRRSSPARTGATS